MFTLRASLRLLPVSCAAALLVAAGAAALPGAKPTAGLHFQLLAHADPHEGYSGDVFGHKGYAYLSSWHGSSCRADGVRVYDVRNPGRPRRVSTFADAATQPTLERTWMEKTIVQHVSTPSFNGELGVVSFQGCGGNAFQGFGLYDVTQPGRPRPISLTHLAPRGSHEIWLQAKGSHAYVYTAIPRSELLSSPDYDIQTGRAQTPGDPDFRIFDVTDPASPVEVGSWGAWRELGVKPWEGRGGFSANFVHSVITNSAATRAYLSYWDLGTVILDIRDPAHPRYLGRTPATDDQGDAHSAALAKHGTVLIETHETVDGHPTLFDISNPADPKKLSDFKLPAQGSGTSFTSGIHDARVVGNRAYFSWYSEGVVAADISNPRRPKLMARYRPAPTTDSEHSLCSADRCRLVWGVYATKSYVLASDMLSGLWILRLR